MNERQHEYLQAMLSAAADDAQLQDRKMSSWEANFMADQQARYDQYGEDVFMSPKQWGVIHRIAEKLGVPRTDQVPNDGTDFDDDIPF